MHGRCKLDEVMAVDAVHTCRSTRSELLDAELIDWGSPGFSVNVLGQSPFGHPGAKMSKR